MNIYEFAKQMEKDGENYYRELGAKAQHDGVKIIFDLLANEEVKHFNILDQLSKNIENAELVDTTILNDAKNIFIEMKEGGQIPESSITEADLYKKAVEIEEKSVQFYEEKANEVENEAHKQILKRMAEEEKKHKFLMLSLVEFITRPQTWVENAEFHKLDEY